MDSLFFFFFFSFSFCCLFFIEEWINLWNGMVEIVLLLFFAVSSRVSGESSYWVVGDGDNGVFAFDHSAENQIGMEIGICVAFEKSNGFCPVARGTVVLFNIDYRFATNRG